MSLIFSSDKKSNTITHFKLKSLSFSFHILLKLKYLSKQETNLGKKYNSFIC